MTVIHADCLIAMADMDADSVDAIVTDPPYDLTQGKRGGSGPASLNENSPAGRSRIGTGGFLGHAWDSTGIAFLPATWEAALRVAKPGAYLLSFGGTRTVHRMTSAIEDAGWEIRDLLCWGYASGFPKSLNIGKSFEPDSPEAAQWAGWGTALKPAWEPIVMARKPFPGTTAQNVLRYGTGALNIDESRIPIDPDDPINEATWTVTPSVVRPGTVGFMTPNQPGQRIPTKPRKPGGGAKGSSGFVDGYQKGDGFVESEVGRWPANVLLTDPIFDGAYPEDVVGGTSEQSGGGNPRWRSDEAAAKSYGGYETGTEEGFTTGLAPVDQSGAYSRFFLVPKASKVDREPVLPLRGNKGTRVNTHATVKPLALMEHLVRLVTPPGGLVLDPFAGSGTTALAADGLGFRWVAIEKERDHVTIIHARLLLRQRGLGL